MNASIFSNAIVASYMMSYPVSASLQYGRGVAKAKLVPHGGKTPSEKEARAAQYIVTQTRRDADDVEYGISTISERYDFTAAEMEYVMTILDQQDKIAELQGDAKVTRWCLAVAMAGMCVLLACAIF